MRETFFGGLHDMLMESDKQDSKFWAKGLLELEVPKKYRGVLPRGTENKEYDPQALGLVGYDGQRLKSIVLTGRMSDRKPELMALLREHVAELSRDLYLGPLDDLEEQVYSLARTQNIRILAALIVIKVKETGKQHVHLHYPDMFDSITPGIGVSLALHFIHKSSDLLRMN